MPDTEARLDTRTADCPVCGLVVHYRLDGSIPGAVYLDGRHHKGCLDRRRSVDDKGYTWLAPASAPPTA